MQSVAFNPPLFAVTMRKVWFWRTWRSRMASVVHKIVYGLRTVGPVYLLRAVPNELARPRLAPTRWLRNLLIAAHDWQRKDPLADTFGGEDCLQFVYDFAASPITFDFASHLAAAEIERRRRGLGGLVVIFVPGPHEGMRKELPAYEAVIDTRARASRIRHILLPMLAMLPSVRGHVVCGSRAEAEALVSTDPAKLYPRDYRVFLPCQPPPADIHDHGRSGAPVLPLFRATAHGRRLAASFLAQHAGKRRPVVITLRHSLVDPERNSSDADWLAFADSLDPELYAPIFIADTDSVTPGLPDPFSRHIICEAATWNLEFRMGLYEAAWLNVAIMHGPLELCWYNERARYLLFVPVGSSRVTSPDFLSETGIETGTDLAFAKPHQRLVWERDEAATISRAFDAMLPQLAALDQEPGSAG